LRASRFIRQRMPPPANAPFFPSHVTPRLTLAGESVFDTSGGRDPSSPTSVVPVYETVLSNAFSPCSSASTRKLFLDGNPAPKPHGKPFDRLMPVGSPRKMKPP